MIGYLRPAAPTAPQRCVFSSYQCALCHELGRAYGPGYRLFARPDLVFFNVLLDAARGQPTPLARRRCALVPFGRGRLTRGAAHHTRLAAAFGLLLLVEKLHDDFQDEGGPWRWLRWRFFAAGGERAATTLTELGCDVDAIRGALRAQAAIEHSGERSLEAALQPTVAVARLLFAQAGAAAIGDCVGRFLFFMDNLLDLRDDLRHRRYNALAAAFSLTDDRADAAAAARAVAIAGARAALAPLPGLVAALPASELRGWLRHVLVDSLAGLVHRFEALDPVRQQRAQLRDLIERWPRRQPFAWVKGALGHVGTRLRAVGSTAAAAFGWRASWATRKAALAAATAMLLLPMQVLAQEAGVGDGGVGDGTVGDGGVGTAGDSICSDMCSTSCASCSDNCGDSCSQACSDTCSQTCNDACNQTCNEACSGFTCC